jgi:quinol monooxygenase YgiN
MRIKWIHWTSIGLLTATLAFAAGRYARPLEANRSRSPKTMDEIQGIARLKIRDGKLEKFKFVASQFMQVARAKDTGTLQYELYFNENQTECLVIERYRDVQALLDHHKNIGGLMGDLADACSIESSDVCATKTPELMKALNGSPVRLFSPYQTL